MLDMGQAVPEPYPITVYHVSMECETMHGERVQGTLKVADDVYPDIDGRADALECAREIADGRGMLVIAAGVAKVEETERLPGGW